MVLNSFLHLTELLDSDSGIDFLEELTINQAVLGKLEKFVGVSSEILENYPQRKLKSVIPEHWGEMTFGEHLDIQGGSQPPKNTFKNSPQEGYVRLYQIRDYGPNPIPVYVPRELVTKTSVKGDILIARYGASGKIFWAENGAYNVALAKFIFPKDVVVPQFAYYLLKSSLFKNLIISTTRVAVDGFNKNDLKNIFFPLPPVDEQLKIVSEIDNILKVICELRSGRERVLELSKQMRVSALNGVIASGSPMELQKSWERIQDNWDEIVDSPSSIKDLRALILNLAVKGRLTPRITKGNSAAKELASVEKAEVKELFKGKNSESDVYPKNWAVASFPNIGQWVAGSGFPTDEQGHTDKEILFCKVSDMNLPANSRYLIEANNTIDSVTAKKLRATILKEGTVVFPKIGGAIATNKRRLIVKPTIVDNNCMGIKPCSVIDTEWLFILLSSIDFVKYQSGTSIPSISQRTLDQIEFGVPPLIEQKLIVEKVGHLMKICDELENRILEKDQIAENFARSIVAASSGASK
jgi:type I restriction enzyme S subunit